MENTKNNKVYVKEFYTLEQLSAELDICERVLRDYVRNGELNASKLGRRYIISREDITEWLKKNKTTK